MRYIGVLGCISIHPLTYTHTCTRWQTHTGKGHQVPACLRGTTSLSHSPWMRSCAQGFSNLDTSQSISQPPPQSTRFAIWRADCELVNAGARLCVKVWCSGGVFLKFFIEWQGIPLCNTAAKRKGVMGKHVEATVAPIPFSHPHTVPCAHKYGSRRTIMRDVNLRLFTDPCMNTYIHINMQKTDALKLGTVGNVSQSAIC